MALLLSSSSRPVQLIQTIVRRSRTWRQVAKGLVPPLVGLALCIPVPARSATAVSNIAVSATVNSFCNLSASPMAFGIYTGAKVDATTTLAITCTNTTGYQIGADGGLNPVYIGVIAKYMLGPPSSKLRYHLYTDAARSIEWGTTAGTDEVAGTGTGLAQTITVYGTIGAGSYGSLAGSYSDTVTFTVTF